MKGLDCMQVNMQEMCVTVCVCSVSVQLYVMVVGMHLGVHNGQ